MLRKKWEEEEEEALKNPVGPVHYANIQYDGQSLFFITCHSCLGGI